MFVMLVFFVLELLEFDYLFFSYNNLLKGIVQGIECDIWCWKRVYYFFKDYFGNLQMLGGSLVVKCVEVEWIIYIVYCKWIGQN